LVEHTLDGFGNKTLAVKNRDNYADEWFIHSLQI
jgi:hypothetical protein